MKSLQSIGRWWGVSAMSRCRISVWVALLPVVCSVAAADFPLVADGEPQAVMLVDDDPPFPADMAARVLNQYLERVTGTKLDVVRAGDIEGSTLDPDRNWVLVGDSRFVRQQGLDPEALAYGEFEIVVGDGVMVVAGRDFPEGRDKADARPAEVVRSASFPREGGGSSINFRDQRVSLDEAVSHTWASGGTLFGVYALLEQDVGVRWLWPGELGTVIPARRTVAVASGQRRSAPALAIRIIRNHQFERTYPDFQSRFLGGEFADAVWRAGPQRYEQDEWLRGNKMGQQTAPFRATHAFEDWWRRFGADHPDYFALHANPETGEDAGRFNPDTHPGAAHHAKLCKANPDVVDQVVRDLRRRFDGNPALSMESVSPNDGRAMHCMCADCRALDPPEGRAITLSYTPTDTPFTYVSLTDRHVDWWNRIADQIAESHPDRRLGAWAYSVYQRPPVRETLRENVQIGLVAFNWVNGRALASAREQFAGWTKAAPGGVMLRPNAFFSGMAFPLNYAREMAADMRRCYEGGMFAAEFGDLLGHWATQGINYYMLARSMWDPHVDPDAVIQDFCEQGFGPAAGPVRAYFDLLEAMTDEIREANAEREGDWAFEEDAALMPMDLEAAPRSITRHTVPREGARVIARHFLQYERALRDRLDEARALLAEDDEGYRARIDFLIAGLDYAHLEARVLDDWFTAEPEEIHARMDERNAFLKKIIDDRVVNVTRVLERHRRLGIAPAYYDRERNYH